MELADDVKALLAGPNTGKGKKMYKKVQTEFLEWLRDQPFCEKTLCDWMIICSTKSVATLWSVYSMLNAYAQAYHNIDFNTTYHNLQKLTKKLYGDYLPQDTPVFSMENLQKIIEKLSEEGKELVYKLINMMATCGFMRCGEVWRMRFVDVQIMDEMVLATIPSSKMRPKSFTFVLRKASSPNVCPVRLFKLYTTLCKLPRTGHFFRNWNGRGGSYVQNMGEENIRKCAVYSALLIQIPHADLYRFGSFNSSPNFLFTKLSISAGSRATDTPVQQMLQTVECHCSTSNEQAAGNRLPSQSLTLKARWTTRKWLQLQCSQA